MKNTYLSNLNWIISMSLILDNENNSFINHSKLICFDIENMQRHYQKNEMRHVNKRVQSYFSSITKYPVWIVLYENISEVLENP